MSDESSISCKIYVNEEEVYSGDLSEIPLEFRQRVIEDLSEWAGTLGRRGLNELIYSHLAWYEEMGIYCGVCAKWVDESGEESEISCEDCGEKPEQRYLYPRDEKLDRIITCVGVISEIRIVGS